MNNHPGELKAGERVLLVFDLALALLALCFVLPRSFAPPDSDHYWNPAFLSVARYFSAILSVIAVLSIAGWYSYFARCLLAFTLAVLALKVVFEIHVEIQLAASAVADFRWLVGEPVFWINVAYGLLPVVWFLLHIWLFRWRGFTRATG